ncbi:MAG: MraY family glycosyltransferase [Clostridia bacterium]|nr:MraY family glycosyltransferase [Clostridia bacterium]
MIPFVAMALSCILVLILTPPVMKLARRWGAVDKPNQRKVHATPMPRLGGLAIYIAFVVSLLVTQPMTMPLAGLLVGATLIVLLGIWDDIRGMPAVVKLLGQTVAAASLIPFGLYVEFITNPVAGGVLWLGLWGIPLTIFWLVAVTNALNLVDGLDGLAGGTALIAALTMAMIAFFEAQATAFAVALVLATALLGFLRYNFHPARIFLGDAGSMLLGFVLAATAIMGLTKSATALSIIIPIVILGIPLFDTAFAILRRCRNGRRIFEPDKDHLHHRLLTAGLSHRGAVLTVYGINLVLAASAVVITRLSTDQAVLLLFIVAAVLLTVANKLGVIGAAWSRRLPETADSKSESPRF